MTKPEWVIYDSKVTQYLGIDGLVLYPFILISNKEEEAKPSLLKHELTHVHQVKREGFCKFYSKYLFYIITNVWKNKNMNTAFTENEFEYEAYGCENEPLTDEEIAEIGRDIPRTDKEWAKKQNKMKKCKTKKM